MHVLQSKSFYNRLGNPICHGEFKVWAEPYFDNHYDWSIAIKEGDRLSHCNSCLIDTRRGT